MSDDAGPSSPRVVDGCSGSSESSTSSSSLSNQSGGCSSSSILPLKTKGPPQELIYSENSQDYIEASLMLQYNNRYKVVTC